MSGGREDLDRSSSHPLPKHRHFPSSRSGGQARKISAKESERLGAPSQLHPAVWKNNSDGPIRITASYRVPAPHRRCPGDLGICSMLASYQPYGMGLILPFYRWKNRGSQKQMDMTMFSPPGEESSFERGPSYSTPGLLPPWRVAPFLPEKQPRRRVQSVPCSPLKVPDHRGLCWPRASHLSDRS